MFIRVVRLLHHEPFVLFCSLSTANRYICRQTPTEFAPAFANNGFMEGKIEDVWAVLNHNYAWLRNMGFKYTLYDFAREQFRGVISHF